MSGDLERILVAIEEYVYTVELVAPPVYEVVFAGPCKGHFLGMSDDASAAVPWPDHVHPDDRALFDVVHETVLDTGLLDVEYRIIGADGAQRWVRDRGRLRREGGRTFIDGGVTDTTELHAVQQQLVAARVEAHELAFTDELTGLANRRGLKAMMTLAAGEPLGFVLLDLDHFKAVNDVYGHETGDHVLRAVGARLRDSVRNGDAAIRMGGEEFLLLLLGVHDEAGLQRRAGDVVEAFRSRPIATVDDHIQITVSVGAVLCPPEERDVDAVLRAADQALYAAKSGGRDRWVLGRLPAA